MDMKLPEPNLVSSGAMDGAAGLYYAVLYGIVSFLLVLVALLLMYVACSKRYRLNWFERNLLETAESQELASSHDALVSVSGDRRSSRPLMGRDSNDDFWVPVGKSGNNLETIETSEDESETDGSPTTSRGSKNSLAVDGGRGSTDEGAVVAIARSDKHVVLTTAMPAKPLISMNARLDLSKIDTALYEEPASPVIESGEESRGLIQIALAYDSSAGMLSIRLIEAKNLVPKDYSGTADPYAKIRLLPDRSNVWQTRIHKKTLNPLFDEDFVFEVSSMALSRRSLEVNLFDFDAYARHASMGGFKVSLADFDLTEKVTLWKNLTQCSDLDDKAELGDLMVSLSFLPSAERLTVVVMKARNLRIVDDNRGASDPFVKVTLLQGGKRLKKKKTSIHRNTLNPSFNERLTFDVSRELLSKCSLEICVYHDGKLGPCELLGRCVVGGSSSCRPEDREFFNELLTNKAANAKWLMLTDPR